MWTREITPYGVLIWRIGRSVLTMCPGFTVSLVNSFLEAVGAERSMVVGNSSGGLVALHLAFSEAARDLE